MLSRKKWTLFICGTFLCGFTYLYYRDTPIKLSVDNSEDEKPPIIYPLYTAEDKKKLKNITNVVPELKNITNAVPELKNITNVVPELPTISKSSFDNERISRELWPLDKNCKGLYVRFVKNFNVTFLASYPRSGNTWTRYLIEAATGVFTGSVFSDDETTTIGFYGEKDPERSGTTIVQKTHGNAINSHRNYFKNKSEPVILLMRNLERSITSHWSFKLSRKLQETKSSLKYNAPTSSYNVAAFHEFVKKQITVWRKFHEEVLTLFRHILVIFYEDLVNDPIKETKRIVEFLGYGIEPQRLLCLKKHPDGLVKKNKTLSVDPFTKQERKSAVEAMAVILKLLKKRQVQPPQEYFEYFKKYFWKKRF